MWYSLCLSMDDHQIMDTMLSTVKTNLFWIIMLASYQLSFANDITQAYIDQYKSIAINEMNEYGIPASIKMAQAILESSSGRSSLARESNNHFGIKCGGEWTGGKAYREDDDYQNGLLVKSCFRAYGDPAESFRAHSEFLANRKSKRYDFLFDLDRYDYKAWAKGLQKAGYATDPKYPSKLISLIEEYELYLLDFGLIDDASSSPVVVGNPKEQAPYRQETSKQPRSTKTSATDRQPVIITSIGVNDDYVTKGYYTVRDGDKMLAIAEKYKMDIKELYFKNRMAYHTQPHTGQRLAIGHYINFGVTPVLASQSDITIEDEFLWEETVSVGGQ